MKFTLNVNGKAADLDIDDPGMALLYALRDSLGLRGPRFGCGLAQCGACTVLVNGQAVRSCVYPVSSVGSARVTTLEGLGSSAHPHPLQQAFIDEQAAQCGYCINGMIMQAKAFLDQHPHPSDVAIKEALANNPCAAAARICGSCARSNAALPKRARRSRSPRVDLAPRDLLKAGGSLIVLFSLPLVAKRTIAAATMAGPFRSIVSTASSQSGAGRRYLLLRQGGRRHQKFGRPPPLNRRRRADSALRARPDDCRRHAAHARPGSDEREPRDTSRRDADTSRSRDRACRAHKRGGEVVAGRYKRAHDRGRCRTREVGPTGKAFRTASSCTARASSCR